MTDPLKPRKAARSRSVDADLPSGVYRTQGGYRLKLYFDGVPHFPGSFETVAEAVAFRDRWLAAMGEGREPPKATIRRVGWPPSGIVRRGVGRFEAVARHAGLRYRLGPFGSAEAAEAALSAFHRKHGREAG